MPYGDGTGPLGLGPMTGRGLGPCGRGLRRGWGYGRGYTWGYPARPITKDEQKKLIKEEIEYLQKLLKDLED